METPATNATIAFLMASNNEDIAQDLANEITALKLELESLREEIMDRRERHQLKAIELERVKLIAANRLEELTRLKSKRPIRDREREELDAMIAKNNEWLDANNARTVIGEGGLWGSFCREEI
jgi:DNA repair exonuclease SbcCD ATPase subunit